MTPQPYIKHPSRWNKPSAEAELYYKVYGRFCREDEDDEEGLKDTRWLAVSTIMEHLPKAEVIKKVKEYEKASARRSTAVMAEYD